MAQFDKLFEPLRIRNVVLRNRIVSTGHAEVYADAGLPSDRQIRYHAEKARGAAAKAPSAKPTPSQRQPPR